MFDFSEKVAEVVRNINKSDLIDWFSKYLHRDSPKCRRLAIRVWGCNTDFKEAEAAAHERSEEVIDDFAAFKRSSEFYPSIC